MGVRGRYGDNKEQKYNLYPIWGIWRYGIGHIWTWLVVLLYYVCEREHQGVGMLYEEMLLSIRTRSIDLRAIYLEMSSSTIYYNV